MVVTDAFGQKLLVCSVHHRRGRESPKPQRQFSFKQRDQQLTRNPVECEHSCELANFGQKIPVSTAAPRYTYRSTKGQSLQTIQRQAQLFDVFGSHERSGEWMDNYDALYGPVGADGYPVPVWNHRTGNIDPDVVAYWRTNGFDLRAYLEANWSRLAPDLDGKLHFAVGEMDNYFLNNGVHLFQDFLRQVHEPDVSASFQYGSPMVGHSFEGVGYDPFPVALLEEMAADIAKHAPPDADSSWAH
jgi:hypothetical protein